MSEDVWDDGDPTDAEKFLRLYADDNNFFWRVSSGHVQNVLDELIDRVEGLEKAAAFMKPAANKFVTPVGCIHTIVFDGWVFSCSKCGLDERDKSIRDAAKI